MVSWLIERAIETKLTCPYVAPNRVQAKNIAWHDHIPRLLRHFKDRGLPFKVNEVELTVQFVGGGRLQLLGVDNKEALRGISNWGAIAMDEYDDWQEDIYPTIIRPNLITYQAPVLCGGTPKGFRNLYRLEQSGSFKNFHFSSTDNPDIPKEEIDALIEEYKAMGMGYYRQEILAEYIKPVGTVYEEWDMDTHFVPFEYDPNLPVDMTWDFGVNDPTVIIWLQENGNEIRVIDYYEASEADLEHFVQVINSKPYRTPRLETGDIAGRARDLTSGKSPIEELARMGHHVRTSSIPDIPTQIRHTHKFIPRLYISSSVPSCQRFRECILNYKYPKKQETVINQSNEIPIHDEFSHGMRAWEYYCWNYQPHETPRPRQTFTQWRI